MSFFFFCFPFKFYLFLICFFSELEIIIADKNRFVQEYDTKYDEERRNYTNENTNFMAQNRALKTQLAKKQRIETDIISTETEIGKSSES